jgi:hypothetical protein
LTTESRLLGESGPCREEQRKVKTQLDDTILSSVCLRGPERRCA